MQHYLGRIENGLAFLEESDLHHLLHVKRAKIGEEIEVSQEGITYLCVVDTLDPLRLLVKDEREDAREWTGKAALAFGILKGDHNELIVQKGTEIGLSAFYPFLSSRAVVKKEGPEDSKLLRLRKIAFEATKQCRRAITPEVMSYKTFESILSLPYEAKFIAYEDEAIHGKGFADVLREMPEIKEKSVLVLIGPEGGFSKEEAKEAVNAGFIPVSLGKRILRAETAALYVASILQTVME